MSARATAKNVRVSPRKARFVIDMIRGEKADIAIAQLNILRNRAAQPVMKVLQSALANADQANPDADVDEYRVISAYVDEGKTLRRFRPRAMGRATTIRKRSSHITLEVGL
ncbi:MAG: 50S ribosomal protein L22 [SAR324 cluster bacterium]|jgi:large subunit ribosomal protein L22|nr:50S ribosomal protein L22 [SAR324 cluster bacterium]